MRTSYKDDRDTQRDQALIKQVKGKIHVETKQDKGKIQNLFSHRPDFIFDNQFKNIRYVAYISLTFFRCHSRHPEFFYPIFQLLFVHGLNGFSEIMFHFVPDFLYAVQAGGHWRPICCLYAVCFQKLFRDK